MINPAKNQESVTLGVDREVGIEAADDNLSARVDATLRNEVARLRGHRAFEALLNSPDDGACTLDAQDETEIARHVRLIGGGGTGESPNGPSPEAADPAR